MARVSYSDFLKRVSEALSDYDILVRGVVLNVPEQSRSGALLDLAQDVLDLLRVEVDDAKASIPQTVLSEEAQGRLGERHTPGENFNLRL